MKDRCLVRSYPQFKDWGGRGIVVCERWLNSFENFYTDLGPRPSSKHSLDRIDNNGNYEPGNCRWATRREQEHNKRIPEHWHKYEFQGKILTFRDIHAMTGISHDTFSRRLNNYGYTVEQAILKPVRKITRGNK